MKPVDHYYELWSEELGRLKKLLGSEVNSFRKFKEVQAPQTTMTWVTENVIKLTLK